LAATRARKRRNDAKYRAERSPEKKAELKAKRAIYRAKNLAEEAARLKAWRAANPEAWKAIAKRAYDKAQANGYYNAQYAKKPEAYKTSHQKWLANNPDYAVEYNRKWREDNRETSRSYYHNREARKRDNGGSHTGEDIAAILAAQRGKCAICRTSLRGADYQVDHIVPLKLGGSNNRRNLQCLCVKCNNAKAAKDPIAFMQERGLLL
jgi:5-methylcytosine-specific restriction endonuclease McrA